MEKYQHILLAVDLQPEDDNPVADRGKELSDATGAKLSLIHVMEHPTYTSGFFFDPDINFNWPENLEEIAKKRIDELGEKIGVPPERRWLPMGSAKTKILEVAKDIDADLIVVGSHGRHGLELLLLGSTANAILHHAHIDILTVRVNNKEKS